MGTVQVKIFITMLGSEADKSGPYFSLVAGWTYSVKSQHYLH